MRISTRRIMSSTFTPSLNPGAGLSPNEAKQAIRHAIEQMFTHSDCTIGIAFLMHHENALALLVVHGGMISLTRSIVKNWDECERIAGLGHDGWKFFLNAVRDFLVDLERVYFHFDFLEACMSEDL